MSTLEEYDIDDEITLRAEFSIGEVLTDPTDPEFKVKLPDGSITTYTGDEITQEATGIFSVKITAAQKGVHVWSAKGGDPVQGREETIFTVVPRMINEA